MSNWGLKRCREAPIENLSRYLGELYVAFSRFVFWLIGLTVMAYSDATARLVANCLYRDAAFVPNIRLRVLTTGKRFASSCLYILRKQTMDADETINYTVMQERCTRRKITEIYSLVR